MKAKELKEIIGEKDDEQTLGVASILNVRSGSAKILPIYIYDVQINISAVLRYHLKSEDRFVLIKRFVSVKTLLLTFEHLKLINCSGNKSFAQPKSQSSINQQIWCNTSVPVNNYASSASKLIRVTESGGILYIRTYWTPPILVRIRIADTIIETNNKIWYYQYRDCQLQKRDIYGCGQSDDPCRTFEFGLQEVSLGIGGNETELIENKTIMISDDINGYYYVKTTQLNQQE
ncbi:MAG: hypothetical protein EZS28_023864 [Streblomastix strix]|uniref:Uncharacterized protein n=1 Tax=Streblomastix strix TaxID=222440 RepID=A0A5J4VDI0_9EUKA|nr:MAG: hypothetical protein EZS28_023864 [Streblomastix strix]